MKQEDHPIYLQKIIILCESTRPCMSNDRPLCLQLQMKPWGVCYLFSAECATGMVRWMLGDQPRGWGEVHGPYTIYCYVSATQVYICSK